MREQRDEQVAAIMIPTGSDRTDRRPTVTITTNRLTTRPTTRRQPTTAPGRRPPVATGRALGSAVQGMGAIGTPRASRPVRGPATGRRASGRVSGQPVSRATYWCRRAFVAALVVGLVLLMAQAGAALGGSSLAAPERSTASSAASSSAASSIRHTVVRPGDSLWSIASRLAPGADPRPVVDALSAARDDAPLVPGETVEWGG